MGALLPSDRQQLRELLAVDKANDQMVPRNYREHELVECLVSGQQHTRPEEAAAVFERAYREAIDIGPLQTTMARRFVVWRTTRAILAACGKLFVNETLGSVVNSSGRRNVLHDLDVAKDIPLRYRSTAMRSVFEALQVTAIFPTDAGLTPEQRELSCRAHIAVAGYLNATAGSAAHPYIGINGVKYLHLPNYFPTPREVIDFELELLNKCKDLVVRKSRIAASKWLDHQFGLTESENLSVMKMLDTLFVEQMRVSKDEARARMQAELEDMLMIAKRGLDLRMRLQVLRLMSRIHQLEHVDPTAKSNDLGELITEAHAEVITDADD